MKEFRKRIFLAPHEIDDLIEFTSFNFKSGVDSDFCVSNVKKPTKYFRITTIANYLEWLCKILLLIQVRKIQSKRYLFSLTT